MDIQANNTKTIIGDYRKGEEIMKTKEVKKYEQAEKIDSKEFAEDFKKLPKREQERIYYMIKGAALVVGNENKTDMASQSM